MTDITSSSAAILAGLISSKKASSVEITTAFLDRLEKLNPKTNSYLYFNRENSLAQAKRADQQLAEGKTVSPLHGVPIAVKDNLTTTDAPTTAGSKILEGWVPQYDATVVRKLREASMPILGKTNLDEFAMGSSTENSAFGPTKNPLDTTRVPGGSSGGSAAAVAAGFAAASLGSDTGGSIRQPASLCGLVGVKPTYGLVSRQGIVAFASSLDQVGPFTHTVADAALMMEVIGGHDPLDSTSLPQPMPSLTSVLGQGVTGLRIGRLADMPDGCEPEVLARMDAAYAALQAAGATIVDISLPSLSYCLTAYYLVAPAEASSNLARYDGVRYGMRVETADLHSMYGATRAAGFGAEVKRRIMLGTYALSAGYFDAYYGKALKVRRLIANDFAAAYEKCDVILTPTSPTVAFPLGDKTSDPLTMYLCDIFTIPTNLAGHAAMSVPFGTGAHNMPVGVQVLAPALGEPTMFRVAAELERAS